MYTSYARLDEPNLYITKKNENKRVLGNMGKCSGSARYQDDRGNSACINYNGIGHL